MLPGKIYKPEDIVKILRKRYWVILVPWAIIAAGTAGMARKLPDMYRSQAVIQVIPPQVPGNIVSPASAMSLQNRLQVTAQTIMTRNRLERLIQDFNLYEAERKGQIMEDVVQGLRNDIRLDPTKGDTFTVSYVGRDPATVMKVTESLASLFKEENTSYGKSRAQDTTNFTVSLVEDAKRKLQAIEDRLTQYKLQHAGEMPEQLLANMNAVQNLNQQLGSLAQQMNTENNAKISLERNIAALEEQGNMGMAAADPAGTAAQQLAAAKRELANMLDVRRLKADHPEVKGMQLTVKRLEAEANTEALKGTVGSGAAVSPGEQQRLARLAAWKDDLERSKQNLELGKLREKELRSAAAGYQARIDKMPIRDAELTELRRDYGTQDRIYQDLLAQRERSTMSVTAEGRQLGEQFVLLEAARMPERPYSPDRLTINLMGILGGLAFGVALVGLLEYRDSTFKTDTEISTALALPVLAVVPVMMAAPERRSDFRRAMMINMGLGSVVFVCLAVLTYSFVFIR